MLTAVIYSSLLGRTRKAAEYIGSRIGADVINVRDVVNLSRYDRIIVGSGVYAGKISKSIVKVVRENRYLDVCLFVSCLYRGERGEAQLKRISEELGVDDAVFFNKVKEQIKTKGSKLDEYATRLAQS